MPKSSRGDASNGFSLGKSLWEGCLSSWSTWWPCSNISSLQTLYDTRLVTSITEAEAQMLRIMVSQLAEACLAQAFDFTHEDTGAQRGQRTSSRSQSCLMAEQGLESPPPGVPAYSFCSRSSPTHHGRGASLMAKVSPTISKPCSEHRPLPCPRFSNKIWYVDCWRELKLVWGKTNSNSYLPWE